MARPLGTGPVHVFIGFGPPGQILAGSPPSQISGAPAAVLAAGALYYGTTREGPDISEDLSYYQVINDVTGPRLSMDEGYAGREDNISLVMSSWTQAVDNMLERVVDPNSATALATGTINLSDIGTLIVSEGKSFGLWLVKASAFKPVNVASGMRLGRYYPTCVMTGPNKPIWGNKENLMVRIFRAKGNIVASNTGTLPLFSEASADFSAGMLNGTAATYG